MIQPPAPHEAVTWKLMRRRSDGALNPCLVCSKRIKSSESAAIGGALEGSLCTAHVSANQTVSPLRCTSQVPSIKRATVE